MSERSPTLYHLLLPLRSPAIRPSHDLVYRAQLIARMRMAQMTQSLVPHTVDEVRIPVPWGHVAGKWWGRQDKRPILCLHGYQESCGSFDPLLQLLAVDTGFLAIDWPGHGYSSYLPNGMFYHAVDSPLLIRRIQQYFHWPKVSILAHSMSAGLALYFTFLYPGDVDMLIQIDGLKPFSKQPGSSIAATGKTIDTFLEYDEKRNARVPVPTYTYEEAVDKLVLLQGSLLQGSIPPHNAKWVLERTIRKSPGDPSKYEFTRDIRLKVDVLIRMQHDDICEYTKSVRCPMLTIKCTKSSYYESEKYVDDVVDILRANNRDYEFVMLEGTHHVHINEPAKVALIVNQFLAKYNHVDRTVGCLKQEIIDNARESNKL